MTTNLQHALPETAAALAALDPKAPIARASEIDAQIAEVDAAIDRAEKTVAELREEIRTRQTSPTIDLADQQRAATALLADEDVVAAVVPIEVLTARKESTVAGIKGLRSRREGLQSRRDGIREDVRAALGEASDPLADALEAAARTLVAQFADLYANAAAAAVCGNNNQLRRLLDSLRDPAARLFKTDLFDGRKLTPSPELLAALKSGEGVMREARRGPPDTVHLPQPQFDHNPYLVGAGADLQRRGGQA